MNYGIISIDVECDKGAEWKIQRPLKFSSVLEAIPNTLAPLFRSMDIPATLLLSPEVIKSHECAESLGNHIDQSTELGTHLHGEFIAPQPFFNCSKTSMMQKAYKPDIEFKKMENLTRLFIDTFATSPTSFRAGRFGLSENTLKFLCDLGYKVDTSVAPFMHWKNQIHFYGAPTRPYFPSMSNPLQSGAADIIEIPVTIGNRIWERFPTLSKTVPEHPLFWGFLRKYLHLEHLFRSVWLRPTFSTVKEMKTLIQRMIKRNEGKQTLYFNIMFHSVEFALGCSPYSGSTTKIELLHRRLESILHYLHHLNTKFITLTEAAERFRESQ
ncbi:hypothetical protein GF406_01955 [candidate division KSB1 bacterium]|nr:hypothetical protein [candidate division KSB1 bacterium]